MKDSVNIFNLCCNAVKPVISTVNFYLGFDSNVTATAKLTKKFFIHLSHIVFHAPLHHPNWLYILFVMYHNIAWGNTTLFIDQTKHQQGSCHACSWCLPTWNNHFLFSSSCLYCHDCVSRIITKDFLAVGSILTQNFVCCYTRI